MKFTDRQLIILSALVLSAPIFFLGVKGHDAANHLIISRLFAEQFFKGDIFPHWLFKAEAGFGSPVLYYFPPLQYYATLIFYPLKYLDARLALPNGYLALYCSATLSMVLSGLACYRCLLLYADNKKALILSLFYLVFTYHLMDLYSRFAFSELWAFVFIPLCIYSAKSNSFTKLTFSFAALILCHMLTVVIFLPVLLGLIIIEKQPKLFLALIFAFALTCFYWLPAISYEQFVSVPDGKGNYEAIVNFLTLNKPTIFISILIPILVLLLTLLPIIRSHKNLEDVYWLLVTAAVIFMSFSISIAVWKLFPFLSVLSFPWRFIIVSSISSVLLLNKIPEKIYPALIVISLSLTVPGILEKNVEPLDKYLSINMLTMDNFRYHDMPQNMMVKDGYRDMSKFQKMSFSGVTVSANPRKREILVLSDKAGWVTLPIFYFPNWKSDYEIRPNPNNYLVQVNLPEPKPFIIKLERTELEQISLAISALVLLGFALKYRALFIFRKTW